MNYPLFRKFFFLSLFLLSAIAFADPQSFRWTGKDDKNADLTHILEVIRVKSGLELSITDFTLIEDRMLANNHYKMLAQTQGGVPIHGQSIRIWTSLTNGDAIQVEATLDKKRVVQLLTTASLRNSLSSQETMAIVRRTVQQNADDPFVRNVTWKDVWYKGNLVRMVRVKGKHGVHRLVLSLSSRAAVESKYDEFPQVDETGEFSVPARIYPIYEEVENEGTILSRIDSELRYLKSKVHRPTEDPYAPLRIVHYPFEKFDPLLGLTVEGRKQGFWAMAYIKAQAATLLGQTPLVDNAFGGGVILDGRYATVSLHPDVPKYFKQLKFVPSLSGQFIPTDQMIEGTDKDEMVPVAALLGRPIVSQADALSRVAQRLPDHDANTYINDGFDEVQVYWSITQMFESLHSMGFTDPDLSTRPFHAFLYNPDISYRDNAYYTDDTINFTTYSAKSQNMARDNSTIWHELGHGVMDRLMGDEIQLADTGGLSEGMADFIAQLVINDVTGGTPFAGKEGLRIFNNMGFYLSNEVHDDGEAYGGAMNDLLRAAMARYGRPGLAKVTDLTLETMRLTRNHPALTANDWFGHMLFADELGNGAVRAPGELRALIEQSLNGRNFVFGTTAPAAFILKNGDKEVVPNGPGSRPKPIPLDLAETDKATFTLNMNLKSSSTYQFKYPVTVKVELKDGPLQGAIHWIEEEKNPVVLTLNSESDTVSVPLTVTGKCDEINRPDGSCVDYAYVQIWNAGETKKPQAKKRFYLRVKTKS